MMIFYPNNFTFYLENGPLVYVASIFMLHWIDFLMPYTGTKIIFFFFFYLISEASFFFVDKDTNRKIWQKLHKCM